MKLIAVGKCSLKPALELEKEYLKRLSGFVSFRVEEVRDESCRLSDRESEAKKIRDTEAARVLSKIRDRDFVVLLDLHGRSMSSEEFAEKLEAWQMRGDVVFVIAGSLGPGEELRKRADFCWKLSDLTFPHMLCRPLVLEQVYRAFMIRTGRSYHK